jgi:hypothetical protein
MLKDAVACLREPAKQPVSSALDGYMAQLFIDKLLNSKSN